MMNRFISAAISAYSRHVPLTRGRGRLQALGIQMMGLQKTVARSTEGASFRLEFPGDSWCSNIYYCGTWESGTLEVIKRVIRPHDTVFDIGANIGWFTVHMARLLTDGFCHAFEPMPSVFQKLTGNCELNGVLDRVQLNQVALGDREGICELYEFEGLAHACNSLSKLGRTDGSAIQVKMQTLSAYIEENNIRTVDLIKVDVEGAEMLLLRGAGRLFELPQPPVWIIELNKETAASFGYAPHDLLTFLRDRCQCEFYVVSGAWGKLERMKSLQEYEHGDNCICIPSGRAERLAEMLP